jgi:ABC-2 type transport system permease protein
MNKAWLVARKEIKAFLTDRADLAYSLLLPIAIFVLLYGAFGGHSSFLGTAYVVNDDAGGEYARLLIEKLGDYKNLEVKVFASAEARKKLDRSDLTMIIVIPAGFTEDLVSGKKATLVFRQRGNGGFEEQVVANMVRAAAEDVAQDFRVIDQVTKAVGGKGIPPERIKATVQKFSEREKKYPIVNVQVEDIGSSPDPAGSFLPGILTMFVLFSLGINSRVLVEEKKKGTLERLMTTQLKITELFAGKFLAGSGRGFIQVAILVVLASLVFRIFTPLTFLLALLISLVFSLAAGALGLLIGAIARTEDQAIWFGVLATITMSMLGGTFFTAPKGSLLFTLGKLSVNTYANEAYRTIMAKPATSGNIAPNLLVLVAVTVLALILSRLFFRVLSGAR